MATLLQERDKPDVSADDKTIHELLKRVAKLRWMGMHDEADEMQAKVRELDRGITVFAEPRDTD